VGLTAAYNLQGLMLQEKAKQNPGHIPNNRKKNPPNEGCAAL